MVLVTLFKLIELTCTFCDRNCFSCLHISQPHVCVYLCAFIGFVLLYIFVIVVGRACIKRRYTSLHISTTLANTDLLFCSQLYTFCSENINKIPVPKYKHKIKPDQHNAYLNTFFYLLLNRLILSLIENESIPDEL